MQGEGDHPPGARAEGEGLHKRSAEAWGDSLRARGAELPLAAFAVAFVCQKIRAGRYWKVCGDGRRAKTCERSLPRTAFVGTDRSSLSSMSALP